MSYPRSILDHLYFWLGAFTNLYLVGIAVAFFAGFAAHYPTVEKLLDALTEPYLGALAVYTVLKEIQKRRSGQSAARRGEWYVAAWLLLLVLATLAVASSEPYRFDTVYKLIIANSLAALMIYIGSRIHRP